MKTVNKPVTQIFGKNKAEIKARIIKIENSLVGVKYKSAKYNEEGSIIEGKSYANLEKRRHIYEIMEKGNTPGCCIALIKNFELEWVKGYGIEKTGTSTPITVHTVFQAASISKVITTAMILHLVDKKLVSLDEPLNNKLKDWKIPDNEFTKEKKITLRHILTHSSGINSPNGGFSCDKGSIPTITQVLNGKPPARNDPVKVEFTPGSKHQYSNLGFVIIEKLLQDLTGKGTNEIAEEILFEPIGIHESYMGYPCENLQKRMASPHYGGKSFESYVGLTPSVFAHGGLLTTPHDLAKITIELMNAYQGNSNLVISTALAKEMFSRYIEHDPVKMWGMTGQGLGVFLYEEGEDFFFAHPGGNEPGSSGILMGSPTSGNGFVLMANSLENIMELFDSVKFTLAMEYEWPMRND